MSEKEEPLPQDKPVGRRVDSKGQQYLIFADGQIRRVGRNGIPIPRIKMSKKERLRLRREFSEVKDLDRKALADKILETPVINPMVMADPELKPNEVAEEII